MFKQIQVFDLDGVLVDSSHRYRNKPDGSIDLDFWFENATPENIAKDKLLPLAKHYTVAANNPEIYTVICTARQYCVDTLAYIGGYLGFPDKLLMRPVGDNTHDAQLKRRQLARLLNLKQFKGLPRFFWDDNIKNLENTRHLFDAVYHVKSEICEND